MSSLTTLATRTLCEEAGCGLTITEFLAAPALAAGVKREVQKLQPSKGDRPFGVQIFGRDPVQMARAAGRAVDHRASLIDINMGCPARKVTKGVAGAALMREPELAARLVRAVRGAVEDRVPVTVKIRSGWDEANRNAPEFARAMVDAGVSAVAVHGRTRMQGFSGTVDYGIIAEVKRAVSVPVIGNGDVVDLESLGRMFYETQCDAVMVGRAALGNPWIFDAFRAWCAGTPAPTSPGAVDRIQMYLRHLHLHVGSSDPRRSVIEMRKFAAHYLRHFPRAGQMRRAIYRSTSKEEIEALCHEMVANIRRLPMNEVFRIRSAVP